MTGWCLASWFLLHLLSIPALRVAWPDASKREQVEQVPADGI